MVNQYYLVLPRIMMLGWEKIVPLSNYILAMFSGTASAILVKWHLKQKAPGLQTFLDVSIIEAANSYIIYNFSCNLSTGKFMNLNYHYLLHWEMISFLFLQNVSASLSIPRNGSDIQILFAWVSFNCTFKLVTLCFVCFHHQISHDLS